MNRIPFSDRANLVYPVHYARSGVLDGAPGRPLRTASISVLEVLPSGNPGSETILFSVRITLAIASSVFQACGSGGAALLREGAMERAREEYYCTVVDM
jgi:hypothetical protein